MVNGQAVKNLGEMGAALAGLGVGAEVALTVHRGNERIRLTTRLAPRPEVAEEEEEGPEEPPAPPAKEPGFLGIRPQGGVVVREVIPGSPAEKAGILAGIGAGEKASVLLARGEAPMEISVVLAPRPEESGEEEGPEEEEPGEK